jgi:extracellular factor (EF) 3-hydroxypalmitic acid methyl ester biosynthesis protein
MTTTNTDLNERLVVCQTHQGAAVRAAVVRLTRHLVVFEVYNPNQVFQTSEVLDDFRIILFDRTVYAGRAVITNLVNTGLVTVCEATLGDSWLDVDLAAAGNGGDLGAQFDHFLADWERLYRVLPEYKVVVADLQTFLTEARLWLEQVELGVRATPTGDRIKLERDLAQRLTRHVVAPITSLFERFEAVAQRVEDDLQPAHRAFAKRQVHPLLLCSPFVYRTFYKPLGYAGDYEVVNMMFRDPYEGGSLFAKMVNVYALQLPPIIAHQNRITFLTERLADETLRVARSNPVMRVFNLGCGPAQEIQRFLADSSLCDMASFTLCDFNEETLAYASKLLHDLKRQHGRKTQLNLVKKSVQQLLKQADRTIQYAPEEQFDFIYCAGLFDYLQDKVCRKLMSVFYEMLAPGGLLLATNVDLHPSRGEMECFLEWHLIHRNTQQMAALAPPEVSPEDMVIKRDATGVNLFLEIRRPPHV